MAIRLISTDTLLLESFTEDCVPKYAILSHTWEHDGEISFQEMTAINNNACDLALSMPRYNKIVEACRKARIQGIASVWVDTCCIDKSSSSELSEAINSMYRWYQNAEVCYAFLSDYDIGICSPDTASPESVLARCRWFSRGWCLQELIAPRNVVFFDSGWNTIGSKATLAPLISNITGIDEDVLIDSSLISTIPVARRMSWAAGRRTTRVEDMAYCLLGIFNISMPMLYGEGVKAFNRLQEEIVKSSNDLSIFAFSQSSISPGARPSCSLIPTFCNLFATSPSDFLSSRKLVHTKANIQGNCSFALTNRGLYFRQAKLIIDFQHGLYHLTLNCETPGPKSQRMYLRKVGASLYARCDQFSLPDSIQNIDQTNSRNNYHTKIEDAYILTSISPATQLRLEQADEFAIRVLSHHHDLSTALQIVQRASSSDRWDIARMQFLATGEKCTAGFWKIFPGLLKPQGNAQDANRLPPGPVYLACGINHNDTASDPSPWLHLYSFDKWRSFERNFGIVTDHNDLAGFARSGNTTDRVLLGKDSKNRTSIIANIQLMCDQGRKWFELELLLEETSDPS